MMKGNGSRILIVDDEEDIRVMLSRLMEKEGFRALSAPDGNTALKMIRHETPDALVLDVKMPDIDGMEVLRKIKKIGADCPVVMMTAYAEIDDAVAAMRAGAYDYIAKPFDFHDVIRTVRRALDERNLTNKIKVLSSRVQEIKTLHEMMGASDKITRLISDVKRVAASDLSVVIAGETGSGKELVARAIHHASPRSKAPFIAIDCGAIAETLLENELFGHEKGSYTGADRQKMGKLQSAEGGTLFLDEIGDLPIGSQAKFLRALQDRTFYYVGGMKLITLDVRIIAACNRDLHVLTTSGAFRQDLFYRLNEFTMTIPPLRERKEDILFLAKRFLDIMNIDLNKSVKGFSESALDILLHHEWHGNVRELQSCVRRAVLLADDLITEEHLDIERDLVPSLDFAQEVPGMPWQDFSLKEIVERNNVAVERKVLFEVLKHTNGNKAKAARILKIDYKTIHTKLKKAGIPAYGGGL